jgi:hypothetical protein
MQGAPNRAQSATHRQFVARDCRLFGWQAPRERALVLSRGAGTGVA